MTAEKWTIDNIKSGFERFLQENNRYPTTTEVDSCSYLPSSKQIQRKFGGLPSLRRRLGLPIVNFGTGANRSMIADVIGKRGRKAEEKAKEALIDKFGEISVHEQKPLPHSSDRFDFFVYAKDGNFGVDVFFPKDLRSLLIIVNLKAKLYSDITIMTIFLNMNEEIGPSDIKSRLQRRKLPLSGNIKVMNLSEMKHFIENKTPFSLI